MRAPSRHRKRWTHFTYWLYLFLSLVGCAKPDEIERIPSPDPDLYLTVETFKEPVPTVSDNTYVYAHLRSGGKEKKLTVLYGEDIQIRAAWQNSNEVTICFSDGFISVYRNRATLFTAEKSVDLRVHLRENC